MKTEKTRSLFDWEVGFAKTESEKPREFVRATVPGAVQLDWAKAKGWVPYWVADQWKEYGWMEDVFWSYRTAVAIPSGRDMKRLFLVFRGIDYRFRIFLNTELLWEQEGMFTPVELEVTGRIKNGDVLCVQIFPAPKSRLSPADRSQADQSCKPAVSYGWDFHPRLIPLGIWEGAWIEARNNIHLESSSVRYELAEDFSRVKVFLESAISGEGNSHLLWSIFDPSGNEVLKKQGTFLDGKLKLEGECIEPQLWWPHDQGRPVLYLSRIELREPDGTTADCLEKKIGFRRVRLVMHEGAWDSPEIFPKSRSHPPMTLEINGRVIFAKGANWVSPEIFPGLLDRDSVEPQLLLVQESNMNLLRMWGGATVQKDVFYDLCDELGLLVWQEFPLACNHYRGTENYLRVLDQESRSIIARLKSHACLALWCGGNELFNAWSEMTDQSAALRLLNRNCYDLDPETPFLMTSPVDGVGHGHYVFRDPENGQEAWNVFQQAANTAYCEFGCPGPGSREILESIIPHEDLFPPRPGTAWETHHAFGVWMKSSHLYLDVLEYYFGEMKSLDQIIELGQLLQAEGYKGLFEEARRQKPKASMALCWCLNEPWPTAANNSLISWPCRPKPALAAVGQSCRPVLASARIKQFQWQEGDCFDPELWLLSDLPSVCPAMEVEAWIEVGSIRELLICWQVRELEANRNGQGPRIQYRLPDLKGDRFDLVLKVRGRPEMDSRYTLKFVRGKRGKKNARAMN